MNGGLRFESAGSATIRAAVVMLVAVLLVNGCMSADAERSIVRSNINSAASRDDRIDMVVDCFAVTRRGLEDTIPNAPADVPEDVIAYGLKEFVGLDSEYEHFDRIVRALKTSLARHGEGVLHCVDGERAHFCGVCYIPSHRHLVFHVFKVGLSGDTKVYAVDLSTADVSVK